MWITEEVNHFLNHILKLNIISKIHKNRDTHARCGDVLLYKEVFSTDCFDEPAVLLMRLRCE